MRIGCHHGEDELHPMTRIGRDADGALIATYADGTQIAIEAGDGLVPELEFDLGDEPAVVLSNAPMAVRTTSERIEEAFGAWLATAVTAVDPQGQAFSLIALEAGGMVLRDSDGDMDTFRAVDAGLILSAVWDGERLLGFAYGMGTPIARADGTFIGAELQRVRDRLKVIASRLKGEWQVVAGEGERLGTDLSGVRPGCHVKIGIQPVHPMPDDFHAEWMWAKVTAVKGERVTATLANEPCTFAIALCQGDEIRFERRDVYAVEDG